MKTFCPLKVLYKHNELALPEIGAADSSNCKLI